MLPADLKHMRLSAGLKWGLGLLAAVIISPVIFLAVKGLVGLLIAGIVGLVLIHGAPLLSRTLATVALHGLKGLARKNPVETRQLIAIKRREELAAVATAIKQFSAEVLNVEGHLKELEREGDAEGAAELRETANKLRQVLQLRQRAWQRAMEAADQYDAVTQKVARRWKAAQAALKAQKLAGPSASKELDRIMSEEALESVETAMNQVFADLEHSMMAEALEYKAADVIEVPAITVKEHA